MFHCGTEPSWWWILSLRLLLAQLILESFIFTTFILIFHPLATTTPFCKMMEYHFKATLGPTDKLQHRLSSHTLSYFLTICHSLSIPRFVTLDVFPPHICLYHFLFPNRAMPKCQPHLLSHDPDGSWDHIMSFVGFLLWPWLGTKHGSCAGRFCIYISPFPWGFSLASSLRDSSGSFPLFPMFPYAPMQYT